MMTLTAVWSCTATDFALPKELIPSDKRYENLADAEDAWVGIKMTIVERMRDLGWSWHSHTPLWTSGLFFTKTRESGTSDTCSVMPVYGYA
jgi:hypothetical protein